MTAPRAQCQTLRFFHRGQYARKDDYRRHRVTGGCCRRPPRDAVRSKLSTMRHRGVSCRSKQALSHDHKEPQCANRRSNCQKWLVVRSEHRKSELRWASSDRSGVSARLEEPIASHDKQGPTHSDWRRLLSSASTLDGRSGRCQRRKRRSFPFYPEEHSRRGRYSVGREAGLRHV